MNAMGRCSGRRLVPAWFVAASLLAGCVAPTQYRTSATVFSGSAPDVPWNHSIFERGPDEGGPYDLVFVEFDDQGVLWNRSDAGLALQHVRELVMDKGGPGALMLAYVHGWKHNAQAQDPDVVMFRNTLAQLSLMEKFIAEGEHRPPRRIVGTFIGWRGYSLTGTLGLWNLTIFDRKNAAEVVGRRDAVAAFGAIEGIWKERRKLEGAMGQSTAAPTRLITIGHSLGGDLLFNAVGSTIQQRLAGYPGALLADSPEDRMPHVVGAYGDLAVLINPAMEAIQMNSIRDMVLQAGSFDRGQRPVLAALTSETDYATGFIFHTSRLYRNVTEAYRDRTGAPIDLDESDADQTALGHDQPFITHQLVIRERTAGDEGEQASFKDWINGGGELRLSRLDRPHDSDADKTILVFEDRQKVHVDRLPYLDVEVSSEIINGHSIPAPGTSQYNALVDAIAGLVRFADYPTEEAQQANRDQATQHMRQALKAISTQ
jgi:hypothetical protein